MFANFGPGHWLVLAVVTVLMMFAGNKLPDAARSLGKSLRIFKSELHELHTEDRADKPAIPPTPVQLGRINTAADQAPDQTGIRRLTIKREPPRRFLDRLAGFRMHARNPGCYL